MKINLSGTNGSRPNGKPKLNPSPWTARQRDPVARMPSGKVDVRKGTAQITGRTGLSPVMGAKRHDD